MSKVLSFTVLILLAIASTACGALGPQPQPTTDPLVFQATLDAAGTQAVQTIAAQLTSTALAQPTQQPTQQPTVVVFTPTTQPTATFTATLPPTATATRVPPTLAPTNTATPSALQCTLVSQSPALGTKMSNGFDFDAVWKIKNSGTQKWEVGNIDIKYDSGDKMQKVADAFDIAKTVNPGEELTITIDMLAPNTAGVYKAVWKLAAGGTSFCTLNVQIEVVIP